MVVEYGLQTIHDRTLDLLNRGHHYDAFLDAYRRTRRRSLDIGVHVILGLPGESRDDMLATARELARLDIHSVKLHNLYAVRNTVLADQVAAGQVRLPEFRGVRRLRGRFPGGNCPAACVIERLCGDAPPEYLVGPAVVPATRRRFARPSRPSSAAAAPGRDAKHKPLAASHLLENPLNHLATAFPPAIMAP